MAPEWGLLAKMSDNSATAAEVKVGSLTRGDDVFMDPNFLPLEESPWRVEI